MADNLFKILKGDFFDQYPDDIQQSSDPDFRGLATKINQLKNELVNRFQGRDLDLTIEDLDSIYIPERSPLKTLEYLAYMASYDFDKSKTTRSLRQDIFERIGINKKTGTVNFLLDAVEHITGISPEFLIKTDQSYVGWDQNGTIDGNPEAINFFNGIAWDQNNEFYSSTVMEYFKWYVKAEVIFLDIKSDGVFDPTAYKNDRILSNIYKTVARFKDAPIPIKIGYIDSVTGNTVILMYVFSRDVMSLTDTPTSGSINNKDLGLEF